MKVEDNNSDGCGVRLVGRFFATVRIVPFLRQERHDKVVAIFLSASSIFFPTTSFGRKIKGLPIFIGFSECCSGLSKQKGLYSLQQSVRTFFWWWKRLVLALFLPSLNPAQNPFWRIDDITYVKEIPDFAVELLFHHLPGNPGNSVRKKIYCRSNKEASHSFTSHHFPTSNAFCHNFSVQLYN